MKLRIRNLLIKIALLLPCNQHDGREKYPQLWYCWPLWTKRIKWVHKIKTSICRLLTDHEWSNTEWGSDGCGVDRWCRWCDFKVTMPMAESPPPTPQLEHLMVLIKKANQEIGYEENNS